MSSSPGPIEGKYEVLGKLREGGMGAIYMVRHRLLDELRIIKVMRPEVAESADQRKRFLREAQTATRLKHGNIVGFYDFFVDDEDTAYMVMEYIDGINLRDMLRNCGALPVSLALTLARQCLSALDYLHRKGIVHRDISPDNIMMTQEEDGSLQAKLIDLGIAKLARSEEQEQLTAADEFIGKLRYSSPEQLTKKATSSQIDGRSDLFSFGVVLYEILTGVCPYGGGSLQDILTARLHKPPMPFEKSDAKGKVSPTLRAIIVRALQTKPEDRYQTSAEFGRALDALSPAESAPETPEAVQQYVRGAIEFARKASAAQNPVGASVQKSLQSKFRISEISIRPLEATDLRIQRTLAKWSDATPRTGQRAPVSQQEETLKYAGPKAVTGDLSSSASAAIARKSPGLVGYILVAAGAAVLVFLGIFAAQLLSSRGREKTVAAEKLSVPARPAPVAVAPRPTEAPIAAPTVAAPPEAQPAARVAEEIKPPPGKPVEKARPPVRAPEPKKEPPVRPAESVAASVPAPPVNRPKTHFCADVGRTAFTQAVTREVAPGFADSANLPPRLDAGRIKIQITVSPEEPLEGQEFTVAVKFVNGGDDSFRLARAEESSPSVRGGFAPIPGIATPAFVDQGGVLELFRVTRALGAGETYRKSFRVVEQRKGDVWENAIVVKPCVEQ